MTNADAIRELNDDGLAELLTWGIIPGSLNVPSCDEDCDEYGGGCAKECPHEKRERAVRKWLAEEY